jgi:hypothetical protein
MGAVPVRRRDPIRSEETIAEPRRNDRPALADGFLPDVRVSLVVHRAVSLGIMSRNTGRSRRNATRRHRHGEKSSGLLLVGGGSAEIESSTSCPTNSRIIASSVGPAEVWGVAIDPETGIVYASDMRTGLWIVEPTGPAAPSS